MNLVHRCCWYRCPYWATGQVVIPAPVAWGGWSLVYLCAGHQRAWQIALGATALGPGITWAHFTQKPVDLLETLLDVVDDFTPEVYDPFAGAGSTLIAAHTKGRVAYLMELDPAYVDVTCRRFQEFTGTLPVLESTGEAHDFVTARVAA